MNKLTLFALACASSAFAAPVFLQCGVTQAFSGGVGSASVTCGPIDAGAGNKLINLSLLEGADANTVLSLGPGGTTTVRVTFGAPSSGPLTGFAPGFYDITGNTVLGGLTASPLSPQSGPTFNFGVNTQTLALFTVGITSALTNGGSVSQSTGTVVLVYDTMAISTQTPEPTTLALMGSALLGLGLLSRKKSA